MLSLVNIATICMKQIINKFEYVKIIQNKIDTLLYNTDDFFKKIIYNLFDYLYITTQYKCFKCSYYSHLPILCTSLLYSTQFISTRTKIRVYIYAYCYYKLIVHNYFNNKRITELNCTDIIIKVFFHMWNDINPTINVCNIFMSNVIIIITNIILNYVGISDFNSEKICKYIIKFLVKYKVYYLCNIFMYICHLQVLYYSLLYNDINLMQYVNGNYDLIYYYEVPKYNYIELPENAIIVTLLNFLVFECKCKICSSRTKKIYINTNCHHYYCGDCFYKSIYSPTYHLNCVFCNSQINYIYLFTGTQCIYIVL